MRKKEKPYSIIKNTNNKIIYKKNNKYPLLLKFICDEHFLERLNIKYETDDFEADSVGLFFGENGFVYAFPKQLEDVPLHKIPNTKIGISICGEINYINEEDLQEIKILLNPSRENDDYLIKARTYLLMNVPINKALSYLNRIDERIKEKLNEPSFYFNKNYDFCYNHDIVVVRSDIRDLGSGLLCLPKQKKFKSISQTKIFLILK